MHLTLKLCNRKEDRTFIIGCKSVNVSPNSDGYGVRIVDSEGTIQNYTVGNGEFDIGYIESFNGATSHIIKRREL